MSTMMEENRNLATSSKDQPNTEFKIMTKEKSEGSKNTCSSNISNCLTSSLQSNITIQTKPGRNRCAIYTGITPLKAGSIVASCLPIATRLLGISNRKRYCSYCLSCPSSSAAAHTSASSMKRCSRCKQVWYCSKECQRRDWNVDGHCHNIECALYVSTRRNGGDDDNKLVDDDNAILLLKVMHYIQQVKHTHCHVVGRDGGCNDGNNSMKKTENVNGSEYAGSGMHEVPVIKCGTEHWNDMDQSSPSPSALSNEANDTWRVSIAQKVISTISNHYKQKNTSDPSTSLTIDDVLTAMNKFDANNFSICNEMLTSIAAGVYPWSAVLNHSCQPNCLVRYKFASDNNSNKSMSTAPTPPVLHFVASRDIFPGDELCHSYVDLMLSKDERAKELRDKYGFENCGCQRCMGEPIVLPWSMPLVGEDGLLSTLCDPFLWENASFEKRDNVLQNKIYSTADHNNGLKVERILACLREADIAFENDEDEDEMKHLELALYYHDNNDSLGLALPPLGPLAYRISGRLLSTYLTIGRYSNALKACKRLVACLRVVLLSQHGLQYHPLLGLQLFTLADLFEGTGDKDSATRVYKWARRVLAITHGVESNMVQKLDSFL